ncbi:MAG: segregation/condensation protein A [Oscillospiraceae bacterium]|nr:segregation/condensation protein A [Oscillospiraceae bacterium]
MLAEITYKLNEFEGPLDLLLHLIAKHKMQLFDIQIYQLIDQYLQFIGEIGPDQLEPTSEFVEMAARLVYMKSVALLPRSEEKEELEKELTGRLIEYSLCKLAAERLRDRSEGINFFIRQPLEIKLPNDYNRKHDPAVLLEALKSIHGRNKVMPDVERFEPLVSAPVVSVESRVIHILGSLRRNKGGVHISDFFANSSGRSETVATYLGILELIRNGRILVDDDGVVTNRESEVTSDA